MVYIGFLSCETDFLNEKAKNGKKGIKMIIFPEVALEQ
jgi:hypothetical protein